MTKLDTGFYEKFPLDQLHESEENPRTISDERLADLEYALTQEPEMLRGRPVIADVDGAVICGNMRYRVMTKRLGWTEGPVYVHEFESPAQRREWMLRDNQEFGEWVPEELAAIVAQQREDKADMRLLGFSEPKLENLLKMYDQADGGGGSGNPPQGGETPEVWGLIVECETEESQATLMEELTDRGLTVRALIPD